MKHIILLSLLFISAFSSCKKKNVIEFEIITYSGGLFNDFIIHEISDKKLNKSFLFFQHKDTIMSYDKNGLV
ncbi:MAG: hypothetical protein KF880_01400 [Ferruginibacter sp.]|nr:hypothetical protein [Ferruginibacter sp.]